MITQHTISDALAQLKASSAIEIVTHDRPDGDAVGSCVAMWHLARELGIAAVIREPVDIPPCYRRFFEPVDTIPADSELSGAPLWVLDCGDLERATALPVAPPHPVVNIDHHGTNPGYGDVNVVQTAASCTGELIYRLTVAAGCAISSAAGQALWIALVTDTGRFSYENTSRDALEMAAAVADSGFSIPDVARRLFDTVSLGRLKLQERAIARIELAAGGRLATTVLYRRDFIDLGCTVSDAENLVNIPRSIEGVEAAALLRQTPDAEGTHVSMRTVAPWDAAVLCRDLGGGGHPRAAGCTMYTPLGPARERLVSEMMQRWFDNGNDAPAQASL